MRKLANWVINDDKGSSYRKPLSQNEEFMSGYKSALSTGVFGWEPS